MKEREFDDEQIHLILEWLSRGAAPEEHFPEKVDAALELRLTEEDHCLLRNFRIAIP